MVILKIENCYSWLIADESIRISLWKLLRFREKDYFHNVAYKTKKWDGFRNFLDKDTGKFLTGLLPEVKLALKTLGHEFKIEDNRDIAKFKFESIDKDFLSPVVLHDYQVEYINQIIKSKRGVVYSPTSSGKTMIMVGLIKALEENVPALILANKTRNTYK